MVVYATLMVALTFPPVVLLGGLRVCRSSPARDAYGCAGAPSASRSPVTPALARAAASAARRPRPTRLVSLPNAYERGPLTCSPARPVTVRS